MNLSSIFGTLMVGGVIYLGILQNTLNLSLFLAPRPLILVLGGTLGLALMVFPISKLKDLFDFLIHGMFLKKKQDDIKNVVDVIRIGHFFQMDPRMFLQHLQIDYIFLKEAAVLLAQDQLSVEEISLILQNRKNSFQKKYTEEMKMLVAIGNFPVGLGLLGSLAGIMGALLPIPQSSSDFSLVQVSLPLALALVPSLWGLALSKLVFLPLSDYANRIAQEDLFSRELAIHGIIMIKQGFPVASVSEAIISELPITDQMMLRNLIFKNQGPTGSPANEGVGNTETAFPPPETLATTRTEVNLEFIDQSKRDETKY